MFYRVSIIVIALLFLLGALYTGATIGEMPLSFDAVGKTVINKMFDAQYSLPDMHETLIWTHRLPRAIVAACCGASLALCGAILQSLLRNPLADPYILGISAGASTGAVSVTIWGLGAGIISMSLGAFIGALAAFAFVALLALRAGRSATAIILSGIAGAQLFNALTAFIVTKWADAEAARGIMFWLLGNVSGVRLPDVLLALPATLIGFIISIFFARTLDAFAFGAESAASLGISIKKTYIILISLCAVLTAVMVSLVGAIGFVGLVIPHAARFLVGVRHNALLPACALIGAVFMIACDVVSRTIISGQVLPIGVITALVGAPAFALLLTRKKVSG